MKRKKILRVIAQQINSLNQPHPVRVGIDGVSASGKTRFADDLVEPLEKIGSHVIRASIDGFHNQSDIRYRRGKFCPVGYVDDSFDRQAILENILYPLGPNGDLKYTPSKFDFVENKETSASLQEAKPNSVLIFEGVLLFCDQLHSHFDFKIFIDASFDTIVARAISRDQSRFGCLDTLLEKYHKRYIPGQKIYLSKHKPKDQAHIIIDNNDFNNPYFMTPKVEDR